jgi:hypothetical protein
MIERSPIYSAKSPSLKIGYIEGGEAFDSSGNKRCNYNPKTGNLLEFDTGKIIGHVSLENFFVGSSWIADELFLKFDRNASPSIPARNIAAGGLTDTILSSGAERALESVSTEPAEKLPETAHQTLSVPNSVESLLQAIAEIEPITSFNKASAAQPTQIRLSGDAEGSPKIVGVKLSVGVEPEQQTVHEVAIRMREHLAQLRRPHPRVRLRSVGKSADPSRFSLTTDRINPAAQLTPGSQQTAVQDVDRSGGSLAGTHHVEQANIGAGSVRATSS